MTSAAFLFPGQGSQHVGMGRSLFDAYPSVRRMFEEASDASGRDLRSLCFDGPDAELLQTDNVQPAITLVNLASMQALREEGCLPAAAAGHSLGEYAALSAVGVLSVSDTMRLVGVRGRAMKAAAGRHPGGMTAVFGLDIAALTEVVRDAAEAGIVEVANHNSPSQVVLTGEAEALRRAGELARQRGAKLIVPLKVSGAWHSRFMVDAQAEMAEALARANVVPPALPVFANVTGEEYPADPAAIRQLLVEQLVRPVRWVTIVRRLVDSGCSVFLEVGPGRVLAGLMKDIARQARVIGVSDTEGLARVRAEGLLA